MGSFPAFAICAVRVYAAATDYGEASKTSAEESERGGLGNAQLILRHLILKSRCRDHGSIGYGQSTRIKCKEGQEARGEGRLLGVTVTAGGLARYKRSYAVQPCEEATKREGKRTSGWRAEVGKVPRSQLRIRLISVRF